MKEIWFTSDTHFYHKSILEHQSNTRKFPSIEEHNEELIKRWNEKIKQKDDVYFLGDFSLSGKNNTLKIRKRLNGHIFYIKGNHDASAHQIRHSFLWFKDVHLIKVNDQEIFLSHYPHLTWNKKHYGVWHLFGHCHGSINNWLKEISPKAKMLDVGVDTNNLYPYNYSEIYERMKNEIVYS